MTQTLTKKLAILGVAGVILGGCALLPSPYNQSGQNATPTPSPTAQPSPLSKAEEKKELDSLQKDVGNVSIESNFDTLVQ